MPAQRERVIAGNDTDSTVHVCCITVTMVATEMRRVLIETERVARREIGQREAVVATWTGDGTMVCVMQGDSCRVKRTGSAGVLARDG